MTDEWLVVYGSLRQGGWLDLLLAPNFRQPVILADWALHYHDAAMTYPVLVRRPGALTVAELLRVPLDDRLMAVVDMELNAGYDLERVTVDGVEALVFSWPSHYPRGPRVAGGDWIAATRKSPH